MSERSIPLAKSYTYEKLCVKKKSHKLYKRALLVQKALKNFFIFENKDFHHL